MPKEKAAAMLGQFDQALKNASQQLDEAKVQETENAKRELEIKDKEADTKKYDAETKRIQADAALLEARAKSTSADASVQAAAVAAAREAVHLMLNTPIEQLPAGALEIPHPGEASVAAQAGAPPMQQPVEVPGGPPA
jgi:hypothetical protein